MQDARAKPQMPGVEHAERGPRVWLQLKGCLEASGCLKVCSTSQCIIKRHHSWRLLCGQLAVLTRLPRRLTERRCQNGHAERCPRQDVQRQW